MCLPKGDLQYKFLCFYCESVNLVSIYVFAAVSIHSHASAVTIFNGLNFSEWREQVNFHLDVLDLDLALLEEKPAAITDTSTETEKIRHRHGIDLIDYV